ncbi:MAG: hypothetical protein QOJ76_2167, partial [Acidobacteriota bacterium]|nr:hypothetical protein [Acidobacteriota bacterium]
MRRREFSGQVKRARFVVPALLVVYALAASLLMPASQARQQSGRPRRVGSTASRTTTTTAAAQQQQAQPTQQRVTSQTGTPSRPTTTGTQQNTGAQQRQTPTPTPVPADAPPQTPGGAPKLRTSPSGQPDEPAQAPSDEEIEEGGVVRVESNLVNLHVRVIDRNNRPISDVTNADFHVFENGVQQQVQFVTREEVPITYGLVVDNSG